jgi:RNA polymerase subunit RPABC4/transcription elongation factor Spt4
MPFALFGIDNDGVNLVVNLLLFFLVVIWLALVYWTYQDALRRIEDPMLVGCATAASLFPFIGTIVYSIVRPPDFLEDIRERELEIKAAEARVRDAESRACRNCGTPVEPSFLRCPSCMHKLKEPCTSCGKPLDPRWRVCPYCEAPVAGASPASERARGQRRSERARSSASTPERSSPPQERVTPPLTREGRLSRRERPT